jgi:two-component system chemotaxis sensor kinase CheA
MLKFINSSISRVYSAVVVIGVIVGLSIFSVFIGYSNQTRAIGDLDAKSDNAVELAAVSLVEPIWNFDEAAIQGVVNAIMLDTDVLGLRVTKVGSTNPEVERIREGRSAATVDELLRGDDLLRSSAKMKRDGNDIATVEIITSTKKVAELVRETSTSIALFAVILVLALAGFIWALGKHLVKSPVDALIVSANQLSSGDLDCVIDTSRGDEIGSLAKSFDHMRGEIRKTLSIIEEQNRTLEEKVLQRTSELRQKTNDIQNMLQNMPQGILTVSQGEVIHPEYSVYLESIFETKEIAGEKLMDVVFSRTNLGSDLLSQLDAVVSACIGEDRMNFDMNSALMVTEFEIATPTGKNKSLELSWSAICNEDDVCEKLMICVRDVTELKLLEAEAGQQKRELETIGQILSISQEKFHEFIESSSTFIQENRQIIESAPEKDLTAVAVLFRNMHTIKGNARTFGLSHLTNVVHETEQDYDDLRKNPEQEWSQTKLLSQLDQADGALKAYAKINEEKLGRKGAGRRGSVDKYLMVPKDQIHALVNQLEQSEASLSVAGAELYKQVLNTLKLIGTQTVSESLSGIIDGLPSLAKELGKEPPKVSIRENGVAIRTQTADLIKNSFMHLLRNSLDHGIEAPKVRESKGKPTHGVIDIDVAVTGDRLTLKLRDDGKGLAVDVIRKKAFEQGLITENQEMTAEELAQMIFASGFSTAQSVTAVSGRGVGMDAVKSFVEREGGTIELRFTGNDSKSEFRAFETVISLPSRHAVQVKH